MYLLCQKAEQVPVPHAAHIVDVFDSHNNFPHGHLIF